MTELRNVYQKQDEEIKTVSGKDYVNKQKIGHLVDTAGKIIRDDPTEFAIVIFGENDRLEKMN